jgi:transcriptional regulator with XRE-family HTH domain
MPKVKPDDAVPTLPTHQGTHMLLGMKIGRAIEHFRRLAGLTQTELAGRTDLSQGNLSRLLSGKQDLTVARLEQIAQALGVRASDIMVYAETEDPDEARWRRLYASMPADQREAALRILEPRDTYQTRSR